MLQSNSSQMFYDYWKLTDDEVAQTAMTRMFLLDNGLWKLAMVLISCLFLSKLVVKKTIENHLKPYLFIYYAFMMGLYFGGFLFIAAITNCFKNFLSCDKVPIWSEMGFQGIVRVYLAYIAIAVKFTNILEVIFLHKGLDRVFFHCFEVSAAYFVCIYHFADNMAFGALPHVFILCAYYYYQAFEIAGKLDGRLEVQRKRVLSVCIVIQCFTLVGQGTYYSLKPNCHINQVIAYIMVLYGFASVGINKRFYSKANKKVAKQF